MPVFPSKKFHYNSPIQVNLSRIRKSFALSVQELFLSINLLRQLRNLENKSDTFQSSLLISLSGVFFQLCGVIVYLLCNLCFQILQRQKNMGHRSSTNSRPELIPLVLDRNCVPSSKARAWRLGLNYKPALNQSTVYHHLSPKLASCFESPTKLDSGRNVISCYFLDPKIPN